MNSSKSSLTGSNCLASEFLTQNHTENIFLLMSSPNQGFVMRPLRSNRTMGSGQ